MLDTARSSQIGLRGSVYGFDDIQLSRDLGFQVITADDARREGLDNVISAVTERAGDGPCFLTFDIDFVDPKIKVEYDWGTVNNSYKYAWPKGGIGQTCPY